MMIIMKELTCSSSWCSRLEDGSSEVPTHRSHSTSRSNACALRRTVPPNNNNKKSSWKLKTSHQLKRRFVGRGQQHRPLTRYPRPGCLTDTPPPPTRPRAHTLPHIPHSSPTPPPHVSHSGPNQQDMRVQISRT
jgi:hypothetical protein